MVRCAGWGVRLLRGIQGFSFRIVRQLSQLVKGQAPRDQRGPPERDQHSSEGQGLSSMKARLIFPPQFEPFQPYLSGPYLKGLLCRHGICASVFDANLDFYEWLVAFSG